MSSELAALESCYPARQTTVLTRHDDDTLMILEPESGAIHTLNASARFVWDCCDAATSVLDIEERFSEHFAVESPLAHTDVEACLIALRDRGLLQLHDEPRPEGR